MVGLVELCVEVMSEPPGSPSLVARLDQKARSLGRQIAGQGTLYHDRSGATFQIVTLLASVAIITFCGLIFHLIHPSAAKDRANEMQQNPEPPPPPPPGVPDTWPPQPPVVSYPGLPPNPTPSPPPEAWWQRQRSASDVSRAAWIELALCVVLCFLLPAACVYFRRERVRQRRVRTVLSQIVNGSAKLRHSRLVEAAPDSPSGRFRGGISKTVIARVQPQQPAHAAGSAATPRDGEMQEVALDGASDGPTSQPADGAHAGSEAGGSRSESPLHNRGIHSWLLRARTEPEAV